MVARGENKTCYFRGTTKKSRNPRSSVRRSVNTNTQSEPTTEDQRIPGLSNIHKSRKKKTLAKKLPRAGSNRETANSKNSNISQLDNEKHQLKNRSSIPTTTYILCQD
ncbi:hypothetical protein JTB14_010178 [Gonioctena quinquepunctata]|nr:hypothetical protein JTB14_010178 [Gonioctena quinquepunctata]